MMSEDKKDESTKDKKEESKEPVQSTPPRGRTFGGRGVEKRG